MPFDADRAERLVGKSRDEYKRNHVVNESLNGEKNRGGRAKDYLRFGSKAEKPAAGVVVVGKDGEHAGVFVNDREFIHSSLSRKEVIKVGKEQLDHVFPKGYELRKDL
jgi:hypothetical protein